jgi:hypothetical protein
MTQIDDAFNKWCVCQVPYNCHSTNMIRCDNTKCEIEWYHMKCLDLPENFQPKGTWICYICDRASDPIIVDKTDLEIDYEEHILDDSYRRIQLTKTLKGVGEA